MCKWGTDVEVQVTVPADASYTGKDRVDIKKIDACIAPIVRALNEAGIRTDSSCCGHGKTDGFISLYDGRELVVRPSERQNCITNPHSSKPTTNKSFCKGEEEPINCDDGDESPHAHHS